MADTMTELTDPLYSMLQQEKLVILNTVDAESGMPVASAISWVYAVNPSTVRFAIDQRSRLIQNLRKHSGASLTMFGSGSVHAAYGQARIVTDALEEVPFKLTCIDLDIESVRDAMFYGARISVEPEYEKTYDKRAAEKLDNQVFAAMKKA